MKYLLFSVAVLMCFGVANVVRDQIAHGDGALLDITFSEGVGHGVVALLLGLIGRAFRPDKFRGFVVGTLVASLLIALVIAVQGVP